MTQGVLVLNLRAALQSWGAGDGKLTFRTTRPFPTKSGVVGCVAAALGVDRGDVDRLQWIDSFGFAVAELSRGVIVRDLHTIKDVPKANGKMKDVELSERFYLAGAHFVAFLEGSVSGLEVIVDAIKKPKWPIYLGRKACPPSAPLLGKNPITPGSIRELIQPGETRIWIETRESEFTHSQTDYDKPINFKRRSFGRRSYVAEQVSLEAFSNAIFDEG